MNSHQRRVARRDAQRDLPRDARSDTFWIEVAMRHHSKRRNRHQRPTKDYRGKPFSVWSRYEW